MFLFKLIPIVEKGNGTKELIKKLREGEWEKIVPEDREKIIEFIDRIFALNSTYRLSRFFRCYTMEEINIKAEKIKFMLSDPVRYRVVNHLTQMLLLANSTFEASEEFLYTLEHEMMESYKHCKNRDDECGVWLEQDENQNSKNFINMLYIRTMRNTRLTSIILETRGETILHTKGQKLSYEELMNL